MAINGTAILVYVDDVLVGSQRGVDIDRATQMIDVSSKDDVDEIVLPGRKSSTLSLESLFVPNNAAQLALETAYQNQTSVVLKRYESGSAVEQATAYVENFALSAPDQDAAVLSVDFRISNGWANI